MEKYAKPVGSGRDFSKRKNTLSEIKSGVKVGKSQNVTEKLMVEQEKEFGKRLTAKKFGKAGVVFDFASIFQLIPAFQRVLKSANADAKLDDYLPGETKGKASRLKTALRYYLDEEYPGGIQQQIFEAFPIILELGFQQNILAKQELKRLKSLESSSPETFPSAFTLFWMMYGKEYDPPFLLSKDMVPLGIDVDRLLNLLKETMQQLFGVDSIFLIPMYDLLLTERLGGKSREDIERENSGLSKLLSRKLFKSSYTKQKQTKLDSCFFFKSKATKHVTTPSLAFIKTVFENLNNPIMLHSKSVIGKIIQGLAQNTEIRKTVNVEALEKDCDELLKTSSMIWAEKRDEYKAGLATFLEYFLEQYIQHSGITDENKKDSFEHLYRSSGSTTSFRNVTLVLAEMLLGELELRHEGFICFYAARSNMLSGMAIETSALAEEVLSRNPDKPQLRDELKVMFSQLVESKCYRPTIAKSKTALEVVSQNYEQPFEELTFLSNEPPDDELKDIVEELMETNEQVAKRNADLTFTRWRRRSSLFNTYWIRVGSPFTVRRDASGKWIDPENINWYMLLTVRDGESVPNVLEVRFEMPSVLKSYETLQKEKKNPKFQPIKLQQPIDDHDPEQRDRIRSANMSLFANLDDIGECTLYFFLVNLSVAFRAKSEEEQQKSIGKLFETIVTTQSISRVNQVVKSDWLTESLLEVPKHYFAEFAYQQDQYLGSILRFAFPCDKVTQFVYAAFPYGTPMETTSVKVGKQTITRKTDFFDVEQFIRYITVSRVFTSEEEAQLFQDHQVRILDLCFTTIAANQNVKLHIFKFYPEVLEKNLYKELKSYYQSKRKR